MGKEEWTEEKEKGWGKRIEGKERWWKEKKERVKRKMEKNEMMEIRIKE